MSSTLVWIPSRSCYAAHRGEVLIEVSQQVLQKHLVAYLASQGVTFKTWSQLDREARAAWEKQCALETACKADLDYWIALDGQGATVRPRGVESHGERT